MHGNFVKSLAKLVSYLFWIRIIYLLKRYCDKSQFAKINTNHG